MKLKRLLPIILVALLLVPAVGWSTIYYLSPSGSATSPYDTWEKAANNLSQILSLDLTGENTIYVAEGTYSGSSNYIALTSSKFCDLSIIGRGNVDRIVFDPGTSTSCYIGDVVDNVQFKNITIKGNGTIVVNLDSASNIKFVHCKLVGSQGLSFVVVEAKHNATADFQQCIISAENYDLTYLVQAIDDSSMSFCYCILYSPNGSPVRVLDHKSTQTVSLTNCVVAKSKRRLIHHEGSGSLEIFNSVFLGSGWSQYYRPTIYSSDSAGQCIIKNSIVLPSLAYPDLYVSSKADIHDVIFDDPGFKINIKGFIIPRVDDTSAVDYALSLKSILAEYGYKGSYFLPTIFADTVVGKLRSLVQSGVMEVGGHTRTHQDLTYDHALHFEYTGSDSNPTVELDSSRVIHLRTDGSDNVDIDTTQPDADTLGEIISNYNGTNNWSISYSTTDGQQEDHFRGDCKAESLAEMSATAAPCDIDFLKETNCENGNCSGLYKTEIYEPRIELTNLINAEGNIIDPQTGQVYETRTFVPPFGAGDDNVVEALRTSGYIGGKGTANTEEALPYNVFKIEGINVERLIVEGDEQQTTKNAELFAINTAVDGLVITVLAHSEDNATLEEWRWILNGFKRAQKHYNIQVTSLQLAIEALKRLGTYDPSTGDVDIHWSMPLFRLRYDSPCIDAGVKIAGIHDQADWKDLAGNMIHYGRAPDIGAYEAVTDVATAWGMLPWYGRKYCVRW